MQWGFMTPAAGIVPNQADSKAAQKDGIIYEKTRLRGGSVHKTGSRHNSFICCACSCISGQIMILFNQLIKLEFGEVLLWCCIL